MRLAQTKKEIRLVLPRIDAFAQYGECRCDALAAIRRVSEKLGDCALIGVGTVLDAATCRAAIAAGAQFVVSPICRPELAQIASSTQRPVMLGAYTPTEAQLAHEAGADFVKIFPADSLGPGYIKALRAPLPDFLFHLRCDTLTNAQREC